jgi:rod shape determining protein RodA
MFDRRLAQNFDWGLLSITIVLGGLGLVVLYSAVTAGSAGHSSTLFTRQIMWFLCGFGVMVPAFLFSYKMIDRLAYTFYGLSILLLVWVLLNGKLVGGAQRWISIGPMTLQPSEIVKVSIIIALAHYYAKVITSQGVTLKTLIVPFFLVLIPFSLIVRQPDLGTAMLILLIVGSITLFIKIERRSFLAIFIFCTIAAPSVWFLLKGYQKQRILTFLNPERDPLGAGYHIIQSKIAIGSGMLTGKGFLKGTQNTLSFLPEQHTDFIFSVLAEEWGLAGSGLLLFLFIILILWGLNVANNCRDIFGKILAFGITAMLFWQVVINIGMVMGLMPVVGVPLPFISYGGSSIMTIMLSIGLLLNVSMRRFLLE